MNYQLIRKQLGWYGLAWVCAFASVLFVLVVSASVFHVRFTGAADAMLSVALIVLTVSLLSVVVMDLMSRQGLATKLVVVLLALLLVLPLLWAPVLGAVLAARVEGALIEYSSVYAGFRIQVSRLLYPLVRAVVSGAAVEMVWNAFQALATIVGFFASAAQLWGFLKRMSGGRRGALEAEAG